MDMDAPQKQHKSWADMNDSDEEDCQFPVLTLKPFEGGASIFSAAERSNMTTDADDEAALTEDGAASASTPIRGESSAVIGDADFLPQTAPSKFSAKKRMSEVKSVEDATSASKEHDRRFPQVTFPSPARVLLPQFVDITVESTIPYHLKSSMANAPIGPFGDQEGDDVDWSGIQTANDVLEVLASSEKSSVAGSGTPSKKLRSDVRRSKAVRLLEDTLHPATAPIPCDDLAKMVNWNRKFRPAVGCLFSFLKKHRETFAYSKGAVALYSNPIAMKGMFDA